MEEREGECGREGGGGGGGSLGLPSTSFPLPEQLTVLASFPGLHAQLLSLTVRKKAGHGGLGTRLSCPAFSVCMQSPLTS